jgi:hypothetical protein
VVSKVFDHDVSTSSILSEIEQLKSVTQIDFAPTLLRWNIDQRWYEEVYMRSSIATAHRSSDSAIFLEAFYKEAGPCMKSLMEWKPPVRKDLTQYLEELRGILGTGMLSEESRDVKEGNTLRNFVHSTVEQLKTEGRGPVNLVFTHGDFCMANLLRTKEGLRMVDWETAGYRSVLFDFYSYFFHRPVSNLLTVDQMALEIREALPVFISHISMKASDVSDNLSALVNTYRRLYYLEYLGKLVQRSRTDDRLDIAGFIAGYINAFTAYEEILDSKEKTLIEAGSKV